MMESIKRNCMLLLGIVTTALICLIILLGLSLSGAVRPAEDNGAETSVPESLSHEWYEWSSPASQLSLRGGTLESDMGQYFRKWLESEGLFPEQIMLSESVIFLICL